jgi:hypothetical protein
VPSSSAGNTAAVQATAAAEGVVLPGAAAASAAGGGSAASGPVVVHIHFGMSGAFRTSSLPAPEPRETTRWVGGLGHAGSGQCNASWSGLSINKRGLLLMHLLPRDRLLVVGLCYLCPAWCESFAVATSLHVPAKADRMDQVMNQLF